MELSGLADLVSGQLSGDPKIKIKGISAIEDAKDGDLVFVLEDKYLEAALKSKASALVASEKANIGKKPAILAKNPRLAMALILRKFARPHEIEAGIHKTAVIHKTAEMGKNVTIGPLVYIGPHAQIGDNTILYPQVTIYENVKIGKRCVIHSGARIGVDGYGFAPTGEIFEKIPQIGGVIIGDEVEIFANVTIARGTLGNTVIGSGTKIDCLTHIAHNCEIGENCAIVSLVGFAGSVKLGRHVTVAGQAGFSGHNIIGDNAVVMARAGVTKDIPANSIVSGFPVQDHSREMKYQAALRRLTKKSE
jgi:UDP-3-O-[3-hydroxymyristoyl] glucosamine N-acyltransferase